MGAETINKQTILFQNNNEAKAIFPSAKDKTEDIANTLELQPYKTVILILGWADNIDEKLVPRLTQLFSRGIARAADEAGSVLIDGGTQAGVMSMMGEGVAGRGHKTQLIGVAPLSKVSFPGSDIQTKTPLEPNHSHFILVEGSDWGSESAAIFKLLKILTIEKDIEVVTGKKRGKQQSKKVVSKIPGLAILAGGGLVTKNEVLRAVRQSLPIIIVGGSGGFADEIATAWQKKDKSPDDPAIAEIIADGELHFHQLSNSVKGIERLIIREFGIDKVLMQAWETFADYDDNANRQQKKFDAIQLMILIVGLLGTTLAICQQIWAPRGPDNNLLVVADLSSNDLVWWFVYYILILIPIAITVLITAANRFKQGNKWLLLRAAAESIKREIYRYRSRAMYYVDNPEQQLSKRVEDITRRTMRTEVNSSSLKPYNKDKGFPPCMFAAQGTDDGYNYLAPDRYIEVRLTDQLSYFQKRSLGLGNQLKLLYWGTFIIGGIGTFLAAIGQQVWIAVTTSIVAGIGTYLGYRQTESTLTKYNQAATDLANVKSWWNALSSEEQSRQQNIDSLVEHTEQVLQSELDGWVQQMQNALAELRKEQEVPTEKEEKKEPTDQNTPGQNNAKSKNTDDLIPTKVSIPEKKEDRAETAEPAPSQKKSELISIESNGEIPEIAKDDDDTIGAKLALNKKTVDE